jgi:hypothetical protein
MPGTETRDPDESVGQSRPLTVTVSREQLLVGAVVVGQALWLGLVMMRGWYSGADLPNLAFADGRSLDWNYLTSTLGGHFGIAQRFVYWLLNRTAPLEWWLTVVIRLGFQALSTVLLWRLFRALVGLRPWLWIVLVGYAFNPFLVPGLAVLNSGLGLVIAQACLIGALLAHVRFTRERRLVDAVVVAVLVLVMLAFAQETFPTLVILPILSFVVLQQGTWRDRVRGGLRLWRGWLVLGVALTVFAGLYLAGDYNSPSSQFTAHDGLWLAGQAWLKALGPALVGGPWHFVAYPHQWSAYAQPPVVLLVLGQVALVGLIVLSVRRAGWPALVAWFIPVWTALACLVLVGTGRWEFLGGLIPIVLRYSFYVPVALALGIVLAFGAEPSSSPSGAVPVGLRRFVQSRDRRTWSGPFDRRPRRVLVGGAVALLLVSSAVSTIGFARTFWKNPAKSFTATLMGSVAERGPGVQLFDTQLPEAVVPSISQMYVADLLALGGASAEFHGLSHNRLVVDELGRVVPAKFFRVADFAGPRQKNCGIYVHGIGTTSIPLATVGDVKQWFLEFQLYEPRSNLVTMTVFDQDGAEIPVTSGSPVLNLAGELVVLHRRLGHGRPALIELSSTDPKTSFCLVHTYVGVPLP